VDRLRNLQRRLAGEIRSGALNDELGGGAGPLAAARRRELVLAHSLLACTTNPGSSVYQQRIFRSIRRES
jgi:hypothetical protein